MLLIITNKDDLAADYLISSLLERKLPYFRLNSEDIEDYVIRFSYINNHFKEEIETNKKKLKFSDVTSVWYRRSIYPLITNDSDFYSNRYISGEMQHLIEGLCLNDKLIWVNPFDSVIKAERKLYQLKVAREIGFKIPDSIISNEIDTIKNFFNNKKSIICKPIYHGYLQANDSNYAIYANRVDRENIDDLNLVYPIYFQEEINKSSDIRVTVVGDDLYSAQITFDSNKYPDWRRKECKVVYKKYELPRKAEKLCFDLVSKLNLKFGAIDLVRTSENEYIFLEINPTGEWAWLEHKLGLPIRKSLIKLFYYN